MVFWLQIVGLVMSAYAFGQVAEARCTQMVNPKYTYICKVSKDVGAILVSTVDILTALISRP